jgi:hypothetical protein
MPTCKECQQKFDEESEGTVVETVADDPEADFPDPPAYMVHIACYAKLHNEIIKRIGDLYE